MVLVQARSPRPSAARVTALSGAFALHVVVFGVLIAPIVQPLLVETRPADEPMWVEMRPKPEVVTPRVERIEVPVALPQRPVVRPAPLPVEVSTPVFTQVEFAVPAEIEAIESTADPVEFVAAAASAGLATLVAPPPRYPIIALRRKWEGVVMLRVEVDAGGRPVAVAVERTSGHKVLDDAARRQVLESWQFVPAIRDGVAVPAIGIVPFDFTISEG